MYDHLENLTTAQAWIASERAKPTGGQELATDLLLRFFKTTTDNTIFLTKAIVKEIGSNAFVRNAGQFDASDGTLDFFFEGFMQSSDRVAFYKNHLGHMQKLIAEEAELEDISIIDRLERVRFFFPQETGLDRYIPNDIDFSQGDMHELMIDDDTTHEHYPVMASSIVCEVIEVIADKFISFINEVVKAEATAESEDYNTRLLDNFKEGYDDGFSDGYAQAKKDILSAIASVSSEQ